MESEDRTKTWRSGRRLAALAAAVALTAAACGGGESAVDSVAGGSATDDASGAQSAPSLLTGEFETISGASFDLGSLEGQDVVLWFWAPW